MIHKIYSGSENASIMEKNATGTESSERGLVCSFNRVAGKPLTGGFEETCDGEKE